MENYSIAELKLMLIYQEAYKNYTTDETELKKIHQEVMNIAERAIEQKNNRFKALLLN
jgi:hypothetical protein